MKILGIDTSSMFMNIGIYDNSKIYTYRFYSGRMLERILVPTIKKILNVLDWQAKDIDYFACSLGPGSFTGVRIGLAVIKGFAWSLNRPVIGVSSLDIIARNAISYLDSTVIPIIDAKRNLVYCSIYKNRNGKLNRIVPYMLLSEQELYKKAKTVGADVILGDGVDVYKENIIRNIKGINILDRDHWYSQPHNLIALALERIKDKEFRSAFKIEPIYLYPKECQISVKRKV